MGNSVSNYLSLTGREMVSEKTTFHCSRYGLPRRNKVVPKNKEIIEEENSEEYYISLAVNFKNIFDVTKDCSLHKANSPQQQQTVLDML